MSTKFTPTAAHKVKVLSLYRNILRQHKRKLLAVQRVLADAYVKQEFRLNKTANEAQVRMALCK